MFETAMFYELMEKLQKKAHANSQAKGFWDGPDNQNIPTKLMLLVSEASEWLEAFRTDPKAPCGKSLSDPVSGVPRPLGIIDGGDVRLVTKEEEEAADILIRLCDLCQYLGIDLGRAVLAKMEYNERRPHKHGGKKV